jgi:hypothetical protein
LPLCFCQFISLGHLNTSLLSIQAIVKQIQPQKKSPKCRFCLASGRSNLKLGSSLAGVAGLALLGWDILNNTARAYQNAKTQEDGSISSKWKTWQATGKVFLTQTFKSLVTWEVAGLGFALGKALIPIGTFPVGGILMGALLASVAYRLLSKTLPTPPPQPIST